MIVRTPCRNLLALILLARLYMMIMATPAGSQIKTTKKSLGKGQSKLKHPGHVSKRLNSREFDHFPVVLCPVATTPHSDMKTGPTLPILHAVQIDGGMDLKELLADFCFWTLFHHAEASPIASKIWRLNHLRPNFDLIVVCETMQEFGIGQSGVSDVSSAFRWARASWTGPPQSFASFGPLVPLRYHPAFTPALGVHSLQELSSIRWHRLVALWLKLHGVLARVVSEHPSADMCPSQLPGPSSFLLVSWPCRPLGLLGQTPPRGRWVFSTGSK